MDQVSEEQPEFPKAKQPPVLFDRTQALIAEVTSLLGGPVIAYWNNPMGSVCHNDVVALYEILGKLGQHETLYLFLKSAGGTGQASLRIVNLLRQYCHHLVALVPLECASAATMIALGANEILMGPLAYLTAVDTSLTHALSPLDRDNDRVSVSLDELTRVIRLWQNEQQSGERENPYRALFQHVHPLVIGAVDRAESLSIMLCKELLAYHMADEAAAAQVANTLNAKYPSHNYPILFEEARRIGLKTGHLPAPVNTLLLELNECYSEMGQRATTDFDEIHSHSNEILNIWESRAMQVFYQQDKDWFYRMEERRWIAMNDNSSWRRVEVTDGEPRESVLHIA
jgi:hypothetical protein